MSLTRDKVEQRLLANHLFPRVDKYGDVFPPCYTSAEFTNKVASKLMARKREDGFGVAAARSTRYDFAPRNMEVPHPIAFAKIARQLKVSWHEWSDIVENPSSAIRVGDYGDKRLFVMDAIRSKDSLVFPGGRFMAKIDITNFYGSVYSHAIPWAVYGVSGAKMRRTDGQDWVNQLDTVVRLARRKETTGISIGPGTSSIVGEIMLGGVDELLRDRGYNFLRFIDDYYYVAQNRDDAEEFVREVRDRLAELKFAVHPGKTKIFEMPTSSSPRWMRELRTINRSGAGTGARLDMIDSAIETRGDDHEGGALLWVLRSLDRWRELEQPDEEAMRSIACRLLSIAYIKSVAVPTVCRLLDEFDGGVVDNELSLNSLLREHVSNRQTDAASWLLYILLKNGAVIESESQEAIVASGDCLTIALLASSKKYYCNAVSFVAGIESRNPADYTRDEYWLVYYQLALNSRTPREVPDSYVDEFEALLSERISFVDVSIQSDFRPVNNWKPVAPSGGRRGGAVPYDD